MAEIKQIKVGSTTYDIRDDSKVPLDGGCEMYGDLGWTSTSTAGDFEYHTSIGSAGLSSFVTNTTTGDELELGLGGGGLSIFDHTNDIWTSIASNSITFAYGDAPELSISRNEGNELYIQGQLVNIVSGDGYSVNLESDEYEARVIVKGYSGYAGLYGDGEVYEGADAGSYGPSLHLVDDMGYGTKFRRDHMVLTHDMSEEDTTIYYPSTSGTLAVITGTNLPELKVRNDIKTGSIDTSWVKCDYITGDGASSPGVSPVIAFAMSATGSDYSSAIYAPRGLGAVSTWSDYEIVNKKYANENYLQSANTATLTVVNKNAALSYGTTTTIAEVAGVPISVTMPSGSTGSGSSGTVSKPTVSTSTTDGYRLLMTAVAGTSNLSTSTIIASDIYAQPSAGKLTANTFYAKSDRRLKENIKEYKPEKSILDLPVVEFDFKNKGTHTIGCIAQDLQNLFPELVDTNPEGYLSIAENKLVYLCLLEIKKLRSEVDELKQQLNIH